MDLRPHGFGRQHRWVARAPSPLSHREWPERIHLDGYPYVINFFALAGEADPAMLMKVLAGEDAFPHGGALKPETRGRQLPLNFNIVDFAKAR